MFASDAASRRSTGKPTENLNMRLAGGKTEPTILCGRHSPNSSANHAVRAHEMAGDEQAGCDRTGWEYARVECWCVVVHLYPTLLDGILELEEGGLRVTLIKAAKRATQRAKELVSSK